MDGLEDRYLSYPHERAGVVKAKGSWWNALYKTHSEEMPGRITQVPIIGGSHLEALQEACRVQEGGGIQGIPPVFLEIRAPQFRPSFSRLDRNGKATMVLNPTLRDAMEALVRRSPLIFSSLGGNYYNALGLITHPRRFDFVLSEQTDLPLIPGHEIIPEVFVREALLPHLENVTFRLLRILRGMTAGKIFHLESPPPIPSEDHIRRFPGVFAHRVEELGVSPALLRYKLWRLQSRLFAEACEAADVQFVPVPPATQDADGFLVEAAWHRDPTHGNAWYGAQVMQQISEIVEPQRLKAETTL